MSDVDRMPVPEFSKTARSHYDEETLVKLWKAWLTACAAAEQAPNLADGIYEAALERGHEIIEGRKLN